MSGDESESTGCFSDTSSSASEESDESLAVALHIQSYLDELAECLGESYAKLAGANAALDTVNRDLDGCVSYVHKQHRRSLRAQATQEEEKARATTKEGLHQNSSSQAEDVELDEMPGEIEKILAKARRVVDPLAAKSRKTSGPTPTTSASTSLEGKGKSARIPKPTLGGKEKGRALAGKNTSTSPLPPQKALKPKPLRLPPRITSTVKKSKELGQDLLGCGQFVASASSRFSKQAAELFRDCTCSPSSSFSSMGETIDGHQEGREKGAAGGLGSRLKGLLDKQKEIGERLGAIESTSPSVHSEQAMLRAQMKELLEERQRVHRKLSGLNAYGQQWKSLAVEELAEGGLGPSGVVSDLTASGKLNSLSMRWVPTLFLSQQQQKEEGEGEEGENLSQVQGLASHIQGILQTPSMSTGMDQQGSSGKFQRKHEIATKARSLLQQKLLQLFVEGKYMSSLLGDIRALKRSFAEAEKVGENVNTVEDAITLERLVALCRLNQHLYLDPKPKSSGGFYFRQTTM